MYEGETTTMIAYNGLSPIIFLTVCCVDAELMRVSLFKK
jgi:hypothetical protein